MYVKLESENEKKQLNKDRVAFVLRPFRYPSAIENGDVEVLNSDPPTKVRVSFIRQIESVTDLLPFLHLSGLDNAFLWIEYTLLNTPELALENCSLYCFNQV